MLQGLCERREKLVGILLLSFSFEIWGRGLDGDEIGERRWGISRVGKLNLKRRGNSIVETG